MGDPRSRQSEEYAFKALGFKKHVDEEELMREFNNICVPEGIFLDEEERNVSVEVKRLIGNQLPVDAKTCQRRKIWERNHITWPWRKTVLSAVNKAHPDIIYKYDVFAHHIVFLVPDTLPKNGRRRLEKRVITVVEEKVTSISVPKRVYVHFVSAPETHFDRF